MKQSKTLGFCKRFCLSTLDTASFIVFILSVSSVLMVGTGSAFADATCVGTAVSSENECDNLLNQDVDVCNVYVRFSDPSDRLLVIAFANITTTPVTGFVQISGLEGGADTAPSESAIQATPKLKCDSYVSLGLKRVPAGVTDCTALAPDFESSSFNSAGVITGSWYCNNPPSEQAQAGTQDDASVFVAQFTVQHGTHVAGELTVLYNTAASNPLVVPFVCPVGSCPVLFNLCVYFDFQACMSGPVPDPSLGPGCRCFDEESPGNDNDIDLRDFQRLQTVFDPDPE